MHLKKASKLLPIIPYTINTNEDLLINMFFKSIVISDYCQNRTE